MKSLLITIMLCATLYCCYGQTTTLSGTVVDENRIPIAGATVSITELKANFRTDSSGKFAITLAAGDYHLHIAHINFKPFTNKISLPLTKELRISLKMENRQLEEVNVVNTGYQRLSKEKLTGSFTTLDNRTFNSQQTTNVLERLEGITSSLTVDRSTSSPGILVRGLSSLLSDRSPLIVLDNFPYEGNLNNLNPGDVESITVLKDAAATSIWGARAGNGVIVITTKKAKFNQPLKINASVNHTLFSDPDLSYLKLMNSKDFISVERMLFEKDYFTAQESSLEKPALTPVVELLISRRDGKITSSELEASIAKLENESIVENYKKDFLSRAISRQYNFSLNKGNESSRWLAFAGFDDNQDAIGADSKRFNVKIENGLKVTRNLDLATTIQLTHSDTRSGRPAFNSLVASSGYLPPYTRFSDENGSPLAVMRDYRASAISNLGMQLLDWNYYPLSESEYAFTTGKINDVLADLKLTYQLPAGFKLMGVYRYQNQQSSSLGLNGLGSYYTRNSINSFSSASGSSLTRGIPLGAIRDLSEDRLSVHQLRSQVDYNRKFGKFSIDGIAGFEIREAKTVGSQNRNYGVNEGSLGSSGVNYNSFYTHPLTGSLGIIPYMNEERGTNNRYVSLYANSSFGFKDRYYLTASLRRDASNLFGVSTNNKWNPLWSLGGAWLLSSEEWMKTEWLDLLKVRMSFGRTGNSNSRLSALTTINTYGTNPYTFNSFSSFSNYANPFLRWERVSTLNLGADANLFFGRLTVSADYYIKKSTDLISSEPIDYTTGIAGRVSRNTAAISSRGVDLEVRSINLKNKLNWQSSFYMNYYRDKVDKYYLVTSAASAYVTGTTSISGIEGMPVYAVYAYRWKGLNPENGNPIGEIDGKNSEDYLSITGSAASIASLKYMGPAFPVFNISLGNTFSYGGFELDFRLTGKFGYYARRPSLSYVNLFGVRSGNAEFAERWQAQGDESRTVVPSMIYPASSARDAFYNNSEVTVISGDHIRLQYVSLGYSFTKKNQRWLPFSGANIRLIASNLGLVWRKNPYNIDPDFPGGILQKSYSLNLQLSL